MKALGFQVTVKVMIAQFGIIQKLHQWTKMLLALTTPILAEVLERKILHPSILAVGVVELLMLDMLSVLAGLYLLVNGHRIPG